ncbi:MAG: translocation/assembly module TamB domain-containing protein [Coxiellaceae bacterium]|nr:translocation/assembly module TamB domain-containing protein [Coxiellaceae bacterium]
MIKRIIVGSLATLIILVLGSIIFFSTPFGLKAAVYLSQTLSGHKLEVVNANGSLFNTVTADQIRYIDRYQRIEVNQLKLDWRPIYLFTKNLNIEQLTAHSVKYVVLKKSPDVKQKKSGSISLSLPVNLAIKNISINKITYYNKPALQTYNVRNTHLQAVVTDKKINVVFKSYLHEPYKIHAQLSVVGVPNNYNVRSTIISPLITSKISGKGNLQQVNLRITESSALGGKLSGKASVQWAPSLLVTSNLNVRKLQLGDHWISGIIKARYANLKNFSVDTRLNTSLGTFNVVGHHKGDWNFKWNTNLTHLERLSPLLLGSVNGQGTITGDSNRPDAKGHIELKQIAFEKNKLEHLKAQWQLHLDDKKISTLTMSAQKIITPNLQVDDATLSARGTLQKHTAKLSMNTSLGKLSMAVSGLYNIATKAWTAKIPTLSLNGKPLDHWRLNHPIQIQYNQQLKSIAPFCWLSSKGGRLCFSGQQTPAEWNAKLQAKINLAALAGIYPENYVFTGQLNADATVNGDNIGMTTAKAGININHLKALLGDGALKQTIRFKQANAAIDFKKEKLAIQQHIRTDDGDILQLQFNASPIPHLSVDSNPSIKGKLQLHVNKLQRFNVALPTTINTSGKLSVNTTLAGKWLSPKIKGIADFTKADIHLPDIGVHLTQGLLVAHTIGRDLNYSLKVFSNKKPIKARGSLSLRDYSFDGKSSITGTDIPVINTIEYQAVASPDINIQIKDKFIRINGKVVVPQALLQPKNFNSTVTLPSSDIVFVNQAPALPNAWKTSINVKITLGKDVKINTFGATGNVTGELTIKKEPGQAVIGNGKLALQNGKFDAHGQKLDIKPATVIYRNSPIDDPNLDISASRKLSTNSSASIMQLGVNDLTVGVNVTGTAKHPKLKLFSSPVSLNQTDILSYLVLGHASGGGSAADLTVLINAFNSSGPSHFGDFMGKLEKGLGLSEFGIESETSMDIAGNPIDSQNSFVVGKYITQKIYLRYSRGLIDQNNTFLLRYMITPKWAIQTTQSYLGSGGDIIYTFYKH